MTLTVLLFAKLRDTAGTDRVAVEVPAGATVAQLKHALAERVPPAAALLERSAIAVNREFATDDRPLAETDEVAAIPPVSGG